MTDVRFDLHDAAVRKKLIKARLRQDPLLREQLVLIGDVVARHVRAVAPRGKDHRGRGKALADSFLTRSKATSVVVASYKPYAAIQEVGGTTPAHFIKPKKAGGLAFNGVVRKIVHHPGAHYTGKHFAAQVARLDGPMIVRKVADAVERSLD